MHHIDARLFHHGCLCREPVGLFGIPAMHPRVSMGEGVIALKKYRGYKCAASSRWDLRFDLLNNYYSLR